MNRAMKLNYMYILSIGLLNLQNEAFGLELLSKHQDSIENHMMTGYGKRGSYKCDIIHDLGTFPDKKTNRPSFALNIDRLESLDVASTLKSAQCLLVSYHVNSNHSLSALIKFGWTMVQHKRVALVTKMGSGLTLDMAANTTKLPFLVGAKLEDGREQFLCPVVGQSIPTLQSSMCNKLQCSLRDKILRVAVFGVPPYFYGDTAFLACTINVVLQMIIFQDLMVQTPGYFICSGTSLDSS